MANEQLRLAILISGQGSTAAAVIESCLDGSLHGEVEPVVVVASNINAGAEIRKLDNYPPIEVAERGQIEEKLLKVFDKYEPDLVAQLGWIPKTPRNAIESLRDRGGEIFNQHPGNPQKFGGIYGRQVMCAFVLYTGLTSGEPVTMAATHYVTEKIDDGRLISTQAYRLEFFNQECFFDNEAIKDLTMREQKNLIVIEHKNVIKTLKLFCGGEKPLGFYLTNPTKIEKDEKLNQAKMKARQLFPRG